MSQSKVSKLEKTVYEKEIEKIKDCLDAWFNNHQRYELYFFEIDHSNDTCDLSIKLQFETNICVEYQFKFNENVSQMRVVRNIAFGPWELALCGISPNLNPNTTTIPIKELHKLYKFIQPDIEKLMPIIGQKHNWITNITTLVDDIEELGIVGAVQPPNSAMNDFDVRRVKFIQVCKHQINIDFGIVVNVDHRLWKAEICDITLILNRDNEVLVYCRSDKGIEIQRIDIPYPTKPKQLTDEIIKGLKREINQFKKKYLPFNSDEIIPEYLNK